MSDSFNIVVPCGTGFHNVEVDFWHRKAFVVFNPCDYLPLMIDRLAKKSCNKSIGTAIEATNASIEKNSYPETREYVAIQLQSSVFRVMDYAKQHERLALKNLSIEELIDLHILFKSNRRIRRQIELRIYLSIKAGQPLDRNSATTILAAKALTAYFYDELIRHCIFEGIVFYQSVFIRTWIWQRVEKLRFPPFEPPLIIAEFEETAGEIIVSMISTFNDIRSIEAAVRCVDSMSQRRDDILSHLQSSRDNRVASIAKSFHCPSTAK